MKHNIIFLIALFGLAGSANAYSVQYADTFLVTVADKTPEHPHYNEGYSQGYVVNGVQGATIVLVRDSLYLFNTDALPGNLVFDFYTVPIGGSINNYRDFVESHDITKDLWVVKPMNETPDTLYYASSRQPWMGGMILIVDSITSSVQEQRESRSVSRLAGAEAYPNPFSEETELRFTLDSRSAVQVELVDALGRVVRVEDAGMMESGERSLRVASAGLDGGIYLYRIEVLSEGKRSVATGKVQVLR